MEPKPEDVQSAQRLLGWAEFNAGKGNIRAARTLINKAMIQLDYHCPECLHVLEYEDGAYFCSCDGTYGSHRCSLLFKRYECP